MDIAEIFGIQNQAGGSKEVIRSTRKILLDETEHIISSLDLNRIAFWTYHEASIADGEDLSELIIEMLQSILSKPESHSPLALQKTLVVTKHVLTYGAEQIVNQAYALGRFVEGLLDYNTILMAQKKQGIEGFFLQLKGGGVDRGGPVREAAKAVHALLSDVAFLQLERSSKADPTSLVPVGTQKAAFVTDEVRLYALKKRMEHEQTMVTKSNLAKADGGFGGGYMSRDGTKHVGAAHGIEEMLKQAEREKKRFSDEQMAHSQRYKYDVDPSAFADYVAPNPDFLSQPTAKPAPEAVADLLSLDTIVSQAREGDLLGLGTACTTSAPPDLLSLDLMGSPTPPGASLWDPIPSSTPAPVPAPQMDVWATADVLAGLSLSSTTSTPSSMNPLLSMHDTLAQPMQLPLVNETKSVMEPPSTDRFAALDDLVTGANSNRAAPTSLDSLTAQSLSTLAIQAPATAIETPVVYSSTSLRISEQFGGFPGGSLADADDEDSENGFIMGGAAGTGVLEPIAPAPAVPPPPPPPAMGDLFG